jgi:two-component system, OmpR family, sensor histidine kinase MtrB
MGRRQPATLRNVLSISAVVVACLAATAAVSLVFATHMLQRMTAEIAASVESIRTIEEAEVGLLLHVRSGDPEQQRKFEAEVRGLLDDAARYIRGTEGARALGDARVAVDLYLEAKRSPLFSAVEVHDREGRAIAALEKLGDLDVAHSRAAYARARHWQQVASVAGIALGVGIVSLTAALVLWLRRRVIRPLFSLADTMKRFGEGERELRASERGPTELRDMTRSFNEMADSIAAHRQAQTVFLGGVAHDLRNPLSALRLAVEMIDPAGPLPPEPQLRRTLAIMSRQISQLERMVGDFLDMARIEAGELALQVEPRDICGVVRDSLELFDASSHERLSITMPDYPVAVACDAVRIGQAITNLVSNALKYSPRDSEVTVAVTPRGDVVTIAVSDHGVGIARADQQRIFTPFQRGAAAKTDVPGTGLGLFNVQRIVHAHDGRIEVESVPGKGSTFRIRLPRALHADASGDVQRPLHSVS